MTIVRHLMIAGVAAAFVGAVGLASAQQAPTRVITNIAGDLYRFQNNFHFSVFYVTDAGIIATDPISADAADWLKAELQSPLCPAGEVPDPTATITPTISPAARCSKMRRS